MRGSKWFCDHVVIQRTILYYKVILCLYYSSTTLYYKVLLQHYSVLLRTTTYYSSTTLYYNVLLQYYCTTTYYSSTALYYKVLLQYNTVLQSTTPVLLRYYSGTTLKRHLHCAEQQESPSNFTKYCACHAK